MRFKFFRVFASPLILFSFIAVAQPNLSDPIPISPEIKIGRLSNGLTYYIRKNAKPENKVELRLVIKAGSILEEDDQQGLAHFTEHMAFNGTKHFHKNELISFLQSIGVEFGADLNAYTSFDETVYILPIPLDKPGNLEKGLLVLVDWASTVAFETEEIDKERGVVLEESRGRKGANDRINQVVFPKLFAGSKYAERIPIGKDEILKSFKPEAIKRFYKDWYRPNLMAVIVVGDLDPGEAEKMIKSHFEKLTNPGKEKPRSYVALPGRTLSEGLVVTDKEATNSIVRIYYSFFKAKEQTTIGHYRESIVQSLFQTMMGQRMQELTQRPNPPFIFGGSSMGGFVTGHETFSSFALVSQAGAEAAIQALVTENERARKFGFTAAEIDRSKKNLMKNMDRAYNERDKTESENYVEEYTRNFLEKEAIPGIENEYNYFKMFLDGISLEEINALAGKIIPTTGNKLVVLTAPENVNYSLPTNAQLLAMTENAAKLEVKPYEEKVVSTDLIKAVPVAGKITAETENKPLGYSELTLDNGIRVILKATDFKNDQVMMTAFRFGGQFLYSTEDRYNAEYAASVVTQMGVGQFSPNDMQKALAGKSASVTPRFGTITEGVGGQSSMADLETLFQLIHLYFTQPRKDDELFKSYITKQQAFVQNMMANPQAVFQDSLLRTLYKNHNRAPRLPNVETFNKINQDRALEIYKERFGNAYGFTFIFIGKFDITAIKPMIATYIASLPSNGKASTFHDVGLRPVKGVVKKEVYRGKEAKSVVNLQFTGEAPYSDAELMRIQALAEVMNIKLIETLRESLGGIYSGGMGGSLSKYPYANYSIGASFPCGPENVGNLIQATWDEINKIKTAGPTEGDLNKVKETWKKQYLENIKDNGYWIRKLQQLMESGSNLADILTTEKRIDALTVKDIQDAALKYLDEKNYLQMVLYPENQK